MRSGAGAEARASAAIPGRPTRSSGTPPLHPRSTTSLACPTSRARVRCATCVCASRSGNGEAWTLVPAHGARRDGRRRARRHDGRVGPRPQRSGARHACAPRGGRGHRPSGPPRAAEPHGLGGRRVSPLLRCGTGRARRSPWLAPSRARRLRAGRGVGRSGGRPPGGSACAALALAGLHHAHEAAHHGASAPHGGRRDVRRGGRSAISRPSRRHARRARPRVRRRERPEPRARPRHRRPHATHRPPARRRGRVTPERALEFGVALSALSFVVLASFVNVLAALLAVAGNLFYVVVYTRYLKRSTPQNIVIGGAAGAVPPLVGWAAATGNLTLPALFLFLIVF